MVDPFFKKWYRKHQKDIKKYIKYMKSSDIPLKKLSLEELREYYKLKIKIWELITSRNQDRPDEVIDEMSKNEIIKDLEFYEQNGEGLGVEWLINFIESLI